MACLELLTYFLFGFYGDVNPMGKDNNVTEKQAYNDHYVGQLQFSQ